MRRSLLALSVVLSLIFGTAVPVNADPGGGSDICIHTNGKLQVQRGTANCFSTPGSHAIATGADSFASAQGAGNHARATNGATAIAFLGSNNRVTASDPGSLASTSSGSKNRVSTTDGTTIQIVNCSNENLTGSDGSNSFTAC